MSFSIFARVKYNQNNTIQTKYMVRRGCHGQATIIKFI